MLPKSVLTGGGQNRWPPLEAFLRLNGGIWGGGGEGLNLMIGAENASGALWGRKKVLGVKKKTNPMVLTYGPWSLYKRK